MKCFKKLVATVSALALVVAGLAGYQANVSAAASIATTPWEFYQTGTSTDSWNQWELCAFSSIETTAGEYFTPTHDSIGTSSNDDALTTYTNEPADGFTAVIESDGWSAEYDGSEQINPYCLRASMKNIAITNGHNYTLSFTAKASSDKLAYVECGDYILEVIKITTDDVTYEYTFTAESDTVDFDLLLGAFVGKYDYSGNDVSDLVGDGETNWSGTVYISDFTLMDEDAVEGEEGSSAVEGEDESSVEDDTTAADDAATDATVDTTAGTTVDTAAATAASDEVKAPAKASIKSAKKAGKKVTVKAKKVANASGYEVAVYKTKKNAKKNKKAIASATSAKKKVVVSSKKIKKAKKVFVKVRAYTTDASGANVYGAWSKVKKVK